MKSPFVMKRHISTHHGILSAGQCLNMTYITSSVEHSQIYVNPLCLAPFLTKETTFCEQFADYLKSIHYFTHEAGSVGSQLKYLVYIDWILFCPECFIFSNTQEGHSFS